MKFKIGDVVAYDKDTRGNDPRLPMTIESLHENYGRVGQTRYWFRDSKNVAWGGYEDQLEFYYPTSPELVKLAEQLLDVKLFSVADANEILESLNAPSSMTPQQAEDKEVQDIMIALDNRDGSRWASAVLGDLIKVLVSNGTLTLKQVERALGK